MARHVQVTKLGRSIERGQYQDKMSYRVAASEGGNQTVFEARVTLGTLETLSEPEMKIKEWFLNAPLPEANSVIDLLW